MLRAQEKCIETKKTERDTSRTSRAFLEIYKWLFSSIMHEKQVEYFSDLLSIYDRSFTTEIDPCLPNPCQNEGACYGLSHGDYKCTCTKAFVGALCSSENLEYLLNKLQHFLNKLHYNPTLLFYGN